MISLVCGWTGLSWAGLLLHGMSAEAAWAAGPGRLPAVARSAGRSLAESSAGAVNWTSCAWPLLPTAWRQGSEREGGSGSVSVYSVGEAVPGDSPDPKQTASRCGLTKRVQPSLAHRNNHHMRAFSKKEMIVF